MKTQIEIHFMCLDNKRIYFVFKTCCLISVLFSTKYKLFHDFICLGFGLFLSWSICQCSLLMFYLSTTNTVYILATGSILNNTVCHLSVVSCDFRLTYTFSRKNNFLTGSRGVCAGVSKWLLARQPWKQVMWVFDIACWSSCLSCSHGLSEELLSWFPAKQRGLRNLQMQRLSPVDGLQQDLHAWAAY